MTIISTKPEVDRLIATNTKPLRITILGATGSIGKSTLDLLSQTPEIYDVVALTADTNAQALATAAIKHNARCAVIADENHYSELKAALSGTRIETAAGEQAIIDVARQTTDCVIAAIVGAAGLKPVYAALEHTARIGLANKECLVCAGTPFLAKAKTCGTQIIPVDSEHSAAFQALVGADPATIEKITLTASGGPFRTWTDEKINSATPEQALSHPNWSMGPKITIDSATMMNKGLELIEALHLFDLRPDQLDTIVHPQSIVHCLVAYTDGSVLAQLSNPDMRTPIALALSWPTRMPTPTPKLNLAEISELTFEKPDQDKFPALRIAREAMLTGGSAPTILNAANEIAVEAFLNRQIGFTEIAAIVEAVLNESARIGLIASVSTISEALELDAAAREAARRTIGSMGKTP